MHRAHRPENLATRRDFSPPLTRHRQGSTPWVTGPASPYLAGPVRAWTPSPRVTTEPSTPRDYGALFQGPKRPPTVTDQGSPYQPPRVIGYQGPSPALAGRLRGSQAPQVEPRVVTAPSPWRPGGRRRKPCPGADLGSRLPAPRPRCRRRPLPPLTGPGEPQGGGGARPT